MTPGPAQICRGDRVLVTRLDYLGDAVLSLPLVDALIAAGAEVDYLTRRPAADLLSPDKRFGRVFALERDAGVGASLSLIRRLRARRYRAVVDLYSNPRSAWLTWLTGARTRVGGDRRGRRHLYTHAVRVDPSVRAAIAFHLEHGRSLGLNTQMQKPVLDIGEDEREHARQTLSGAGVSEASGPLVGIHPGGKWSVKRWPAESFAALVETVRGRMGAQPVVFTGPGEAGHTDAVRRAAGEGAVYLPELGIRDAAAVIDSLDAMVACDGGIMHVAVAVGTPTVGIFGSAEPDVWFPYEGFGPYRAAYVDLDCRPCHRHECPLGHTDCLNALDPEAVFAVLRDVIGDDGRRARGG